MTRRASGEGSIGRRDDGKFYGAVRLNGKRQWVYGDTRKEVVEKLKALQVKAEQGIDLDADKIAVKEFLAKWLSDVAERRCKPRAVDSYRRIVDLHLTPRLGHLALSKLTPAHVQALVNDLTAAKNPRTNKPFEPGTIRNVRAVLRQALNQAMRWRLVAYNAATLVELPRVKKYQIEPLSLDEARQFLNHLKGHRLEALYLMALLLGLREGEVLGLLIADLDLERAVVRVTGTLQYQNGKLVRESTKTRASTRQLPLPASLVPLLKNHLARQQQAFPDNPYAFASTTGTPIIPRNLVRQFKALLKKAKLRNIRFHDLRHSCATFLIANGTHARTVMELLGHSQIAITMNTYAHVLQETQVAAVDGVDKLLGGR